MQSVHDAASNGNHLQVIHRGFVNVSSLILYASKSGYGNSEHPLYYRLQMQLPRLTQMLRASVLGQNDVDISDMYRQRASVLKNRGTTPGNQVQLQCCVNSAPVKHLFWQYSNQYDTRIFSCTELQVSGPGTSKLAQKLIGAWSKAPKAAKQDYEKFIKAVLACLDGESSSAEVQEASTGVWNALQSAPPPDKLQQSRLSLTNTLKPYR